MRKVGDKADEKRWAENSTECTIALKVGLGKDEEKWLSNYSFCLNGREIIKGKWPCEVK